METGRVDGESNIRAEARESGNNSVQVWRSAECSDTNTELSDRIFLLKHQEKVEIREKLGRNQGETTRTDKGLYQEVLASVDCPVTLYTGGLSLQRVTAQ